MSAILNQDHSIHWHCFRGNLQDYYAIKEAFLSTKFAISVNLILMISYWKLIHRYLHPTDFRHPSLLLLKDTKTFCLIVLVEAERKLLIYPQEMSADYINYNKRPITVYIVYYFSLNVVLSVYVYISVCLYVFDTCNYIHFM